LRPFGTFFPFWYVLPIRIWQPCQNNCKTISGLRMLTRRTIPSCPTPNSSPLNIQGETSLTNLTYSWYYLA
jgi:hypothetical protein